MLKEIITGKAGFPFYTNYWENYFCKMNGEQIKESLKIIFHFNKTFEILKTNDLAVEMVVTTMIENIKRDAEKRIKQVIANKENGKKGGRPSKNKSIDKVKVSKEKNIMSESLEKDFELFWKNYVPVKTSDGKTISKGSKLTAKAAFDKKITKHTFDVINSGLRAYLTHCRDNNQFTCQASVFLNQERYLDEYDVVIPAKENKPERNIEF